MSNKLNNPFSVETPEQMEAKDINDLFVAVPGTEQLKSNKHVFLHGHRGCGKSMMFRRMAPDCQMLLHKCELEELPFLGVYLSIKKTGLDVVEYDLLENESVGIMFAEHAIICHLASALFRDLLKSKSKFRADNSNERLYSFITGFMQENLLLSGLEEKYFPKLNEHLSTEYYLEFIIEMFDKSYKLQNNFFKRKLARLINSNIDYDGPLLGFHEFFVPMVEQVKKLPFFPNGPVYFFIDDADNLNLTQTKVLNTWVSYRTYDTISLKISTQMRYKTYFTLSGARIENPHDYSEVLASSVYTGKSRDNKYLDWVNEIVGKRLKAYYGKEVDPKVYFPIDEEQEEKIRVIAEEYKTKWKDEGKGYRAADDAYRYARPEYMKRISGKKKGGSNYTYAGFTQLVHVSSGIIRLFLDPASKMFAEQHTKNEEFFSIESNIQNKVLRQESDYLLFADFERRLNKEGSTEKVESVRNQMTQLRNLIVTVGAMFRKILLDSNRSERRVFSFALSDYENISLELENILSLGIQEGYLYESYIGAKESSGRTKLFVLNRRLAPYFKLDPMGFSGYKFVTCEFLNRAMTTPKTMIYKMESEGIESMTSQDDQLSLL